MNALYYSYSYVTYFAWQKKKPWKDMNIIFLTDMIQIFYELTSNMAIYLNGESYLTGQFRQKKRSLAAQWRFNRKKTH